jgi:hypothetical protein
LVFATSPTSDCEDGCALLACNSLGEIGFVAPFRGLPVETRLPTSLDETRPVATCGVIGAELCLVPRPSLPNPAVVPRYRLGFASSTADNGLALEGVPILLLTGVDGESPPIRDTRAPDRGVIFPPSFEVVGERKSSLRDVADTVVSARRPRRGGLMGDAFFDATSLGVNGVFWFRMVVLSVGVKGLAGVAAFCLSRDMVEQGECRKSAGWTERSRILTMTCSDANVEQCHDCKGGSDGL